MRNTLLLIGLMFGGVLYPIAGQTVPPITPDCPSLLMTALARCNTCAEKKALGTLRSQETATASFEAVIVSDPVTPEVKVKGLKVELKQGDGHLIIYVDDDRADETPWDSLKEFQDALARLAGWGDRILRDRKKYYIGDSVANRALPDRFTPRLPVLNVGWYKEANVLGVAIDFPTGVGPRFFFPKADIADLRDIVARGRAFLASQ
jgi:hypothetical protein